MTVDVERVRLAWERVKRPAFGQPAGPSGEWAVIYDAVPELLELAEGRQASGPLDYRSWLQREGFTAEQVDRCVTAAERMVADQAARSPSRLRRPAEEEAGNLERIRRDVDELEPQPWHGDYPVADVRWLLGEIDWLTQALAEMPMPYSGVGMSWPTEYCPFDCGWEGEEDKFIAAEEQEHAPGCPIARARGALAARASSGGGAE